MPNEHPEMVFLHFPLLLVGYCQSLQTSTISLQLLLHSGLLFPLKSLVVAILTLSAGKYSGRVRTIILLELKVCGNTSLFSL